MDRADWQQSSETVRELAAAFERDVADLRSTAQRGIEQADADFEARLPALQGEEEAARQAVIETNRTRETAIARDREARERHEEARRAARGTERRLRLELEDAVTIRQHEHQRALDAAWLEYRQGVRATGSLGAALATP